MADAPKPLTAEEVADYARRARENPDAPWTSFIILGLAESIAAREAEVGRLRETNARLNRRCQEAESIATARLKKVESSGVRNLGRMLANYAAAHYKREVERLTAERDDYSDRHRDLNIAVADALIHLAHGPATAAELAVMARERIKRLTAEVQAWRAADAGRDFLLEGRARQQARALRAENERREDAAPEGRAV